MSETSTLQSEAPAVMPAGESHAPSIEFFAVGLVLNLALIAAFVVWAIRQWKK